MANSVLLQEVLGLGTGRLKRPGFGRRRRPVAVGIFVPRRAAHTRDDRPFGCGQMGVIVEEEAL